jgi:adenosylmethionine-8-amino-7-oxononanoate aminotransferase
VRREIVALDKRWGWHPYTPMGRYLAETDPLVIARAEGSRIYDVDGKSYIDANASWWVATLGHRHPRLVATLRQQSEQLCHVAFAGITHEPAARLAAELCAAAPAGLCRAFFSDDGSTAVEVALRLALGLWRNQGRAEKRRFVALAGGFHGETMGASALGGLALFRAGGGGPEVAHVPVPPTEAGDAAYVAAVDALRALLAAEAATIAAVIVEPVIQGAAGMRVYAPDYLADLRRLCDAHEVLLVFDEVFSGYGRTGPMWACEHAGVAPDLLCLAKGLSGGILPMGATLATARVFDAFLGSDERAFFYGHSYCGHPLGAAIAREVLAIYRDERILEAARPKATRIAQAFAALAAEPGVARARALGMVGAVDLAASGGYLGQGGWAVYREALRRGAYLRPLGDTVYIAPPLNIPDADLDELLAIVKASLAAARG